MFTDGESWQKNARIAEGLNMKRQSKRDGRGKREGLKWLDWHSHTYCIEWKDFNGKRSELSPVETLMFSSKRGRRGEKVINFPSVQGVNNLTAEKMSDF